MAVGTVSGANLDEEWQLITTNSPSAAATSTFSSISGYKKLMMVWRLPTFAASANIYFTLNNDSTTKYYSGGTFFDGTTYNIHDTFFWLNAAAATSHRGYVIIDNVNKSIPQIINGIGNNTAFTNGMWTGLAPVTSIEFKTGSTMTGTIYLYGIAA